MHCTEYSRMQNNVDPTHSTPPPFRRRVGQLITHCPRLIVLVTFLDALASTFLYLSPQKTPCSVPNKRQYVLYKYVVCEIKSKQVASV